MPIIYREDGSLGSLTWEGKGSQLTKEEIDQNFAFLYIMILTVQEFLDAGFSIMDIDVDDPIAPTMMIITTNDYQVFNIPMPVAAFLPRGPWTNGVAYARLNIVDVAGVGQFWARVSHTSAAVGDFDPEAIDGDGNLLWEVFTTFSAMMRWRGDVTAGELYKVYDVFYHTDYGAFLVEQDHEGADEFDPYALGIDDEPLYRWLAAPPFSPIKTVTEDSYIFDVLDVGKYIRFTHVDGCVITIPDYVEYPIGAEVIFRQCSAGPLTFTADAGFTLNPQRVGFDTSTFYEGAEVMLKFVDISEGDLCGPYGEELPS